MIACDEKFFLSVRRSESCALRIIGSAGEELQSKKRMSGAAFAQINLDRIRLPGAAFACARDDKIERETSNHSCVA